MESIELLIDRFSWLVPRNPVLLSKVVDQIVEKFNACVLEYCKIPNLWMHKNNAINLPKNEELNLTIDQLQINAIRIPICDQTAMYVKKDFRPVSCGENESICIYLAYEEQTGYCYSNSNRLFLEVMLMQGIAQSDINMKTEKYEEFGFFLKSYNELYCGIEAINTSHA